MNAHTDPLVEDYLSRLNAAAWSLPPQRRDELVTEIRDHLQEGLRESATKDEASVRNLIERLGSPEEIVNAAADSTPSDQVTARPVQTNGSAVVSLVLGLLWLVGVGSLLALFFGYRARREIKRADGNQQGWILATVGIVLGWVGIAMLLVLLLGAVGLVAGSASGGNTPVPVSTSER